MWHLILEGIFFIHSTCIFETDVFIGGIIVGLIIVMVIVIGLYKIKTQHNMCLTPLCAKKKHTQDN
jgi:hypothetical protein